ncbi:hypothetical protein SAMN06265784_10891 [Paraburkholderia susongensis]|uniref:Uncharacterized protein n=1 Tax=Paraburkholderia susongensis TaxID=1515439 RepID=A0A1X7LRX0_9BURK|nr:hypothetical protein SAMN06265784_10891 [Paraburkholderia susongensis]
MTSLAAVASTLAVLKIHAGAIGGGFLDKRQRNDSMNPFENLRYRGS